MNGVQAAVSTAMTEMTGGDAAEADLAKKWWLRWRHADLHDKETLLRYERDRAVARGVSEWQVDTNLVGSIIEILCAFIYAKDPDWSVTVADSVDNTRKKLLKETVQTLQIVISRMLRDAGIFKKAQRWVRSASTVGAGWLCPALQTRTQTDVQIQNQLNDLQQQLTQIQALRSNIDEGVSATPEADEQQILDNMKALQAKLERVVATGIALDFYSAEHITVAPECTELVGYLDAPWIRKRLYKTKLEIKELTGWDDELMKRVTLYRKKPRDANTDASGTNMTGWIKEQDPDTESLSGFGCVLETWSRVDGVVYTAVEGVEDRWAKPSFAPTTGSRFYDLFLLGFHYVEGDRHPQSDAQQLASLQDEYGRTRSNFAEHRKRSIPMTVWNGAMIDASQLDKINNAEAGENVAVNFMDPAMNPQQAHMRTSGVGFDPAMYSTDMITRDMEKVSGAQDALQSSVSVAKTATEAGIENEGFGARIGVRRGEMEATLSEMGLYVAQLCMQALPEEFVIKIAGIGAVWPKLTVDEIFYAFNIEVKAGSTGKPNKKAKREAWAALLPNIEKMIVAIGNFRNAGQEWAAQPYINMLKYTAEVLEFEGDIDDFIPVPPPPPPEVAVAQEVGGALGAEPAPPPMVASMEAVGSPASSGPPQ